MQYRELLHEWAWYFHEPKASVNAAHECNNRDMHLITRVSVQYRELLHEWAWYFHEPKASVNAAHECNNRDMHANKCNKVFIIHYHNSVVSLLTQSP